MNVRRWATLAARCCAGVLLTAGCHDDEPGTQVMVVVDAESAARERIAEVYLQVVSGEGPIDGWTPRYDQRLTRGDGSVPWPLEVSLVPRDGDTSRSYLAVATARDADGAALAQARAVSGYVEGKSLRLPLVFELACLDAKTTCSDALTCRAGDCVDAHVDPATLLPFEPNTPALIPGGGSGSELQTPDAGGGPTIIPDSGSGRTDQLAGGGTGNGTGTTCEPGSAACAAVEAVPVEQCPEDRCQGCPDGYVKEGDDACTPLLAGLGLSSGVLSPTLNAIDTHYAIALPLLADSLVLTPLAANGVRIEIDGTAIGGGEQYRLDALPVGERSLVIALSDPALGARSYSFELQRGGSQRAYLKASNTSKSAAFGRSVALAGDTLAVGAPGEDSGAGSAATMDSGAAYVFVKDGDGFAEQAYLKATTIVADARMGTSVALDGDTLAVGAPGDHDGGAVYVYQRSGGEWALQKRLIAASGASDLAFGSSLALSGDTLVVGAPSDDGDHVDSGSVYYFTRDGSLWSAGTRLDPESGQSAGWFGSAVAFDGERLVVGATGETSSSFTSGAAYVFERSAGGYAQKQRLLADNPGPGDFFGEAVAIEGDTLIVGAFGASTSIGSSGALYVFAPGSKGWEQRQRLAASNPSEGASFGARVALHGDVLLTGAEADDSDAHGVGGAIGGSASSNSGAAYVFVRRSGKFEQLTMIKPDAGDPGDGYGFAVALDGDTIVVGADAEDSSAKGGGGDASDNAAQGAGAVYVVR